MRKTWGVNGEIKGTLKTKVGINKNIQIALEREREVERERERERDEMLANMKRIEPQCTL